LPSCPGVNHWLNNEFPNPVKKAPAKAVIFSRTGVVRFGTKNDASGIIIHPVYRIQEPGMDPWYIPTLEKCPEHRKANPTF